MKDKKTELLDLLEDVLVAHIQHTMALAGKKISKKEAQNVLRSVACNLLLK